MASRHDTRLSAASLSRLTRCNPVRRLAVAATIAALAERPVVAAAAQLADKPHGGGPEGPLTVGSLVQVTLGLLVVVVTIFAFTWVLRRYGRFQSGANGSLKVMGGLSVGPRERVVLLQIGDKQLLIGVAPGRVQMLHALGERVQAAEVRDANEARQKRRLFSAVLKREQ